ncbi:MAG: serine/threonine protein kinase [Planctomycetaceae bacterium]|nr:serine/threonine protein kinase [Planctomycetaceae bacterium]
MENGSYRQLLKSGLVSEDILRQIERSCENKHKHHPRPVNITLDYSSSRSFNATPDVTSTAVEQLQHLPKLRYPRQYPSVQYPSVHNDIRQTEQPPAGNPHTDTLVKKLESLGYLNRWQAGQLMEGRTKFSLNRYRICDALGQGGYGHCFLAHDPETFQFVAVKVLPLTKETPELMRRFQNEIELQRKLLHPNLVRFIASGEDGSVSYLVHEFIDGGDLRQLMKQECPLPVDVVCPIIAQVAGALAYLHTNSIVHRDIKPANILLSSTGTVKVIDMGLAVKCGEKQSNASLNATMSSKVAGTVDYLAPEQLRSPNEPSPVWDIYSLGITMYQMLTGNVPFPGGDSQEKFRIKLETEPKDARIYNQAIPFDAADLMRLMISNQPNRRTVTAQEVADRLDAWTPSGGLKSRLEF